MLQLQRQAVDVEQQDAQPLMETGLASTGRRSLARPIYTAALITVLIMVGAAVRHLKPTVPVRLADRDLPVTQFSEQVVQCPGSLQMPGLNGSTEVQLVNAKVGHLGVDAGQIHIEGGTVVMHMEGRAYFADKCVEGSYNNEDYKSVSLLGKTVQFTVDLAGIDCGCNVAFYFVSMKQNSNPSNCNDYYCDANSVCGVECAEVDIMEANSKVWRSTLHLKEDNVGGAAGYGGTGPHTQTWTSNEYGPGATCIDTNKPFLVLAHFPVHDGGKFQGMMVDLQQEGSPCGSLTASVGWYEFGGEDALVKLTNTLKAGMVPVVSYWKSDDMLWLDGNDVNGETPCAIDRPLDCPLVGPRILNFEVSDFKGYIHKSTMELKPTQLPAYGVGSNGAANAYDAGAGTFGAAAGQAAYGAAAPDTAAGWQQVNSGGQVYWYNAQTGETSWDAPR